ncbi:Uma2 family endonuclease [Nocardia sp. NPDC050175]|uniref:Uma2 family endonuclease n=1 Tax=Nocardia sp. NPDC050175 TaxID=3364317 RepID=UPI00379A505A
MSAIFDWAKSDNLQPEPITVEIWRQLPEDFCRQVEVINGAAIRAEAPIRSHQTAARRLVELLESAAKAHVSQYQDVGLDVNMDFDVVLWELPRTTIRRPDAALFECAPDGLRPLPASLVKLVVEVVSPGTEKIDIGEKKADYALAGIPWYWIVWVADNQVSRIETYVLDIALRQYRPYKVLEPAGPEMSVDVPIHLKIDWDRLSGLTL